MARELFAVEKGLSVYDENSSSAYNNIIRGSGVPGGDTGIQDDSPIGSIYMRSSGALYVKIADANSAADWEQLSTLTNEDLKWRNDDGKFRAATNDTLTAGNTDPTGWSDNESAIDDNDFVVGDIIVSDQDGTPSLFEVTAIDQGVGNDELTIAAYTPALADGDKMIVHHWLPDSGADNEGAALVVYSSGAFIKVADMDWEIAKGIYLSSGYTPANGDPAASQAVETAVQYLDGNQDDIQTASGLSQGDTSYGTFTNDLLADSQTSKQLFQRLEDLLDELKGVQATGITTSAQVDAVPHASVKSCKWIVEAFETGTPANRQCVEVLAMNDGTNVDDTVYAKLKLGSSFGFTVAVDINGGNMRLMCGASASATVTARRVEVVKDTI